MKTILHYLKVEIGGFLSGLIGIVFLIKGWEHVPFILLGLLIVGMILAGLSMSALGYEGNDVSKTVDEFFSWLTIDASVACFAIVLIKFLMWF